MDIHNRVEFIGTDVMGILKISLIQLHVAQISLKGLALLVQYSPISLDETRTI